MPKSRANPHVYRTGPHTASFSDPPDEDESRRLRTAIEPWLSALFQSEHLSLLVGNGLTTAIALEERVTPPDMRLRTTTNPFQAKIESAAKEFARRSGREEPNIEDQLQSALALQEGLKVLQHEDLDALTEDIRSVLRELIAEVTRAEAELQVPLSNPESASRGLLISFLMSLASRAPSRERLNIFTTNYDRLLEHACDLVGLRVLDRFVGRLSPQFRSSRLTVDYHYSPPGIRGEPRYLEGVVRLTKLHGSLDWIYRGRVVVRTPLAFGDGRTITDTADEILVYPNPGKEQETLYYPYSELFRDFASAICQPNSTLVTYGYGFGDEHINRIIKDMLSIPSTHLAIVSWDWAQGRVARFLETSARPSQTSLLIGSHFADLRTLVQWYLPKPSIDPISTRRAKLIEQRGDLVREPRSDENDKEEGVS